MRSFVAPSSSMAADGPVVPNNADGTFAKVLARSIFCYPFLWMTGFAALYIPFAALVSGAYLSRTRAPWLAQAALGVGAAIVLSIPIGALQFGADFSRVLSSLYNVSAWVLIAGVLTLASRIDVRRGLSMALVFLLSVQLILVVMALSVFPGHLPIPVFSEFAQRMPGYFGSLGRPDMLRLSWLGESRMRTAGIMGQGVSAGGFSALAALAVFSVRDNPMWSRLAAVLAAAPVVYMSLSRSTYGLVGVVLVVGVAALIFKSSRFGGWAFVSVMVPLSAVALLTWGQEILLAFNEVEELRSGSSVTRGNIYQLTLEYLRAHPFPFLGYGVKPQEEGLVASIATHSTYLGLAFRGGVIGLLFYVTILVSALRRSVRSVDVVGVVVTTFVAGWTIFADLDIGHLVPVLFAFMVCPDLEHRRSGARSKCDVGKPHLTPTETLEGKSRISEKLPRRAFR